MTAQADKVARFRELHAGSTPLLMPNPWDAGSAKLLASLGFEALATTSSGFAATFGRMDGSVTRDEVLAHAVAVVSATDVPVSADLENCFADEPEGVAETIRLAVETGLAGGSVEDFTGDRDAPIYDEQLAAERVAAAAEAAHRGSTDFVLTARAENYLHGQRDLANTIPRLQAYQEAGADVLFAPGIVEVDELRQLVASVDKPVSVIAMPGAPTIAELTELGVARVSVGGAFAYVGLNAVIDAAHELQDHGTYGYWDQVANGRTAIRTAFTS